jgi:hypothetical protein
MTLPYKNALYEKEQGEIPLALLLYFCFCRDCRISIVFLAESVRYTWW